MEKRNKSHHKRKDRKHKKERSKKEHYLRKEKEIKQVEKKEVEEKRYKFDEGSSKKLIKVLRDLISYNKESLEAIPQVFDMLDGDQEIEITDIEDGTLREGLEKIFLIFEKQIERKEDADGRWAYYKAGKKSLKDQISNFMEKAKSAPNVDHLADLFSDTFQKELSRSKKVKEPAANQEEEAKIREEIQSFDQAFRPKTLIEIHQEKNKNHSTPALAQVLSGNPLSKRFSSGKFIL